MLFKDYMLNLSVNMDRVKYSGKFLTRPIYASRGLPKMMMMMMDERVAL